MKKRRVLSRFNFLSHPIVKFPWEILFVLCVFAISYGIVIHSLGTILPAVIGGLIFYFFFSIKRFSFIDVSDNCLRIKFGCIVDFEVPFSDIKAISYIEQSPISGIGVRICGREEVAVVSTTGPVVILQLRKKSYLRLFGLLKITFTSLRISPERKSEFLELLRTRIS